MTTTRVENMKRYLAEAERNPIANRLYIEDLKIAIPMFEKQILADEARKVVIQNGWKE